MLTINGRSVGGPPWANKTSFNKLENTCGNSRAHAKTNNQQRSSIAKPLIFLRSLKIPPGRTASPQSYMSIRRATLQSYVGEGL